MIKKAIISFSILFGFQNISANSEVQRILEGYMIAKAEDQGMPFTEEQIKDKPFTIQVATYINEKDAISHVEELKVQEQEAYHFPTFVRGQVWFKVCVGHFSTDTKAESYRKDFAKRMDEPVTVVVSLLDRPGMGAKREVASEVEKKEVMPIPLPKDSVVSAPVGADVEVKLIKKTDKALKHHQEVVATSKPFGTMEDKSVATESTLSKLYVLQVGAYPTEALAQARLAQLKLGEVHSFVQAADVQGKTWYRAFVGKFSTHREAKDFQKTFQTENSTESFVRQITN